MQSTSRVGRKDQGSIDIQDQFPAPNYLGKTSNKLVTQILDALLESVAISRLPIRVTARGSPLSSEPNVQNVLLAMTVVAIDSIIGETHLRQRN